MAAYRIYKDSEYVDIPALLEKRFDVYSDCVAFEKNLNGFYGEYDKVTLRVPKSLNPEVYEGTYGDTWFVAKGLDSPTNRLGIYTTGGEDYAYYDFYEKDEDGHNVGRKIRVRMRIFYPD